MLDGLGKRLVRHASQPYGHLERFVMVSRERCEFCGALHRIALAARRRAAPLQRGMSPELAAFVFASVPLPTATRCSTASPSGSRRTFGMLATRHVAPVQTACGRPHAHSCP